MLIKKYIESCLFFPQGFTLLVFFLQGKLIFKALHSVLKLSVSIGSSSSHVLTISGKISKCCPITLHYYSLPVTSVTIHNPLDTSAKKHGVKINSVYRLGAHEMEIAWPNTQYVLLMLAPCRGVWPAFESWLLAAKRKQTVNRMRWDTLCEISALASSLRCFCEGKQLLKMQAFLQILLMLLVWLLKYRHKSKFYCSYVILQINI